MPAWLDDAVFYEIYPQSFQDTNGDGIGDFAGILQKLDYIRSLGCNAVWMNPCFESPFGDAGYDVSDYCRTAPRYGTNEELKAIFEAVHARGMHILLDLVAGHTAISHPWFQASMKAEKNAFTDRYVWTDSVWKSPENMACIRGISDRDGCAVVNFFSHQPALNYGFYRPDPNEPWQQPMDAPGPRATLAALKDIMRFWLSMGVDGFRVDMASSLVRGDEDCRGILQLWHEIRGFLDAEFPEAVLVSEWGEPDRSLQAGFHMDFLLHFGPSHYNDLFRCEHPYFSSEGKGDISAFVRRYMESLEKSGRKGMICIPSGNHDMARLAGQLHGDELKIAFAFLLTMPGAPFIYYGDEIGMRYLAGLRSVEGGYYRTGARSPMQWDSSKNAGFSTADADKLYISIDPDENRPTVEAALADKNSLWYEIQKLIEIRHVHPALGNRGGIFFVYAEKDSYPFSYLRTDGHEVLLVILNPANREVSFSTELHMTLADPVWLFGGLCSQNENRFTVPACSAGIYTIL